MIKETSTVAKDKQERKAEAVTAKDFLACLVAEQMDRVQGKRRPYATDNCAGQLLEIRGVPFAGVNRWLAETVHKRSRADVPIEFLLYPAKTLGQPFLDQLSVSQYPLRFLERDLQREDSATPKETKLLEEYMQEARVRVRAARERLEEEELFLETEGMTLYGGSANSIETLVREYAGKPCLLVITDGSDHLIEGHCVGGPSIVSPLSTVAKIDFFAKRRALKEIAGVEGPLERFLLDEHHAAVATTFGFSDWPSFPLRRRLVSYPFPSLTVPEILTQEGGLTIQEAETLQKASGGHEGLLSYLFACRGYLPSFRNALENPCSGSRRKQAEKKAKIACQSMRYLERLIEIALPDLLPKDIVEKEGWQFLIAGMAAWPSIKTDNILPYFRAYGSNDKGAVFFDVISSLGKAGFLAYCQAEEGFRFVSPWHEIATWASSVFAAAGRFYGFPTPAR